MVEWPRRVSKSDLMSEIQSRYLKRSIMCDMHKEEERCYACVCERERETLRWNRERSSGCAIQRERASKKKTWQHSMLGVWDTLCIRRHLVLESNLKKVSNIRIQPKVDSNIWTGDHSICKSYVKGIQSSFRFSTYNIPCTSTYINLYSNRKWFPICIQTRECLFSRMRLLLGFRHV